MMNKIIYAAICFLFSSTTYAQTPTLQQVTTAGNNTTDQIGTPSVNSNISAGTLSLIGGATAAGSLRGAQIKLYGGANAAAGVMTFLTGNGGGGLEQPERMRISVDGNMGLGTSSPVSRLQVVNSAQIPNSPGTIIVGLTNAPNLRLGYNTDYAWIQSHGPSPLHINEALGNVFMCAGASAGNVGIGTNAPAHKLDVNGKAQFRNGVLVINGQVVDVTSGASLAGGVSTISLRANGNSTNSGYAEVQALYSGLNFNAPLILQRQGTGNVGIGVTNPTQKLTVAGTVLARRVKVSQPPSADWPDYVFDSSYQLRSLSQVEQYIQINKHLPDVPSAAEVKKEGIDLGDNQAILLKKIEELTLYILNQEKRIRELEARVK